MKSQLLLLGLASFLLISCAENASSPVSPFSKNDGQNDGQAEHSEHLRSLKYQGRGSLGLPCHLFITLHEGEVLLKVAFRTSDGHSPSAGHGDFYLYESSTGKYYPVDSAQPESQLSLSSILLKDRTEADPNSLSHYISQSLLDQSIRIEFNDSAEAGAFTQALEEVLRDESRLEQLTPVLDQIQVIEMVLAHGDHYHSPTCRNYSLSGIEEAEFGHDGDDDHDHDH